MWVYVHARKEILMHLGGIKAKPNLGSIPGLGISPGEENGNPHQYSCLENPMDRGAWWAIVHEVTRVRHDLAPNPHDHPFIYSVFQLSTVI